MADYSPNAVLTHREDLNEELSIFRVRLTEGELPPFLPGQYAELVIPHETAEGEKVYRRSYSIASAPSANGELEFYIVRVNDGYFTPRLWSMQAGSRLWLGPKIKGKFTLEGFPDALDLVMVATGTGLAPFLAMLRAHENNPPWRKFMLIHGARFERDLGYRKELEAYAEKFPWFYYLPALTRDEENTSWTGKRGRVQTLFTSGAVEEMLGEPFSKERSHFLLCGNPQMIDDVQILLESRDFKPHKKKEPGNIHVERYW